MAQANAHILEQKGQIRGFQPTWSEWFERFTHSCSYPELLGLLHIGFEVWKGGTTPEEDWPIQRICTYLEVADSFAMKPPGPQGLLRIKAMNELVDNFFTSRGEVQRTHWTSLIHDQRVFDKVVWFFDPDRNAHRRANSNLGSEPTFCGLNLNRAEKLHLFLEMFVEFVWGMKADLLRPYYNSANLTSENSLAAFRPKVPDILLALGKLPMLLDRRVPLDESTMAVLEELALKRVPEFKGEWKLPRFPNDPPDSYASLEEVYRNTDNPIAPMLPCLRLRRMDLAQHEAEQEDFLYNR